MTKIKAAVVGATGYTGGELIRLLVNHPQVEIISLVSKSKSGQSLSAVFPDLLDEVDLNFTDAVHASCDVVFLCLQHGDAKTYLDEHPAIASKKIIDLSRDFRLKEKNTYNGKTFVYGLPELNKEQIKQADYIANPGCFATAIQLALLPLAKNKLITSAIHVNATTGSTGAGIKLSDTTHFSWRQNNLSTYNVFNHPHNEEIIESVVQLQSDFKNDFLFVPQRGSFTRGILATVMLECKADEATIVSTFNDFYKDAPFTFLLEKEMDLKMVVNTNKCFITIKKHGKHILVTSIIDNLLKGAAGQAVQNMNLMFGLDESEGLRLKSSTF